MSHVRLFTVSIDSSQLSRMEHLQTLMRICKGDINNLPLKSQDVFTVLGSELSLEIFAQVMDLHNVGAFESFNIPLALSN